MGIVQYNLGNTTRYLTPLIDFNMCVDTDFGLISLISREYLDKSVFSVDLLNKYVSIKSRVKLLYEREDENPILSIMKNPDKELADQYYNEFMESKYLDILSMSMITEIPNVIDTFYSMGNITSTFLVSNDYQINYIRNILDYENFNIYKIEEIDNMNQFNQFYFKSIYSDDLALISNKIITKTIYLANYKFNIDKENGGAIACPSTSLLYKNRCIVSTIDIYNKGKLNGGTK